MTIMNFWLWVWPIYESSQIARQWNYHTWNWSESTTQITFSLSDSLWNSLLARWKYTPHFGTASNNYKFETGCIHGYQGHLNKISRWSKLLSKSIASNEHGPIRIFLQRLYFQKYAGCHLEGNFYISFLWMLVIKY